MKNTISLLFLLLFLVGVHSCQKDSVDETAAPEGLNAVSNLSGLMSRVVQSPTTEDNVLDGTGCFAVVLPVQLTVNSVDVNVLNSSYCQTVSDIVDAYATDDDIIYFEFPIRLRFRDFHEVTVSNQTEFDNIRANCPPDDGFGEIECIDFNFPLVINTYNTNTQTPGTVTLSSNVQLYNFLNGLSTDMIYNIVYPISMTTSDGENVVFNSNAQLQAGIENAIHDCDDYPPNNDTLSEIIIYGQWKVQSFIEGSEDETSQFNGYLFTFNSNGTSIATKNNYETYGTWMVYTDDGFTKLELTFSGDLLSEIEEDWRVIEYSSNLIKLRHVSGGNGETSYLTFSKL